VQKEKEKNGLGFRKVASLPSAKGHHKTPHAHPTANPKKTLGALAKREKRQIATRCDTSLLSLGRESIGRYSIATSNME